MISKTVQLDLFYSWGVVERQITYYGESLEEIAADIDRDNNELLYYLQTGDEKGEKAFCFGGFMFQKNGIYAAKMSESFFD